MKTTIMLIVATGVLLQSFFITGCTKNDPVNNDPPPPPPPPAAVVPTVSTTQISDITTGTAGSGGNITSDGGASVTARGVCWSVNANPTVTDQKSTDGTGTGSFTTSITSLTPNTTYNVRAYATNSAGTGYGNSQSFTTKGTDVLTSSEQIFPGKIGTTASVALDGVNVTCELINGLYIYQGDIILPGSQGQPTKGAALDVKSKYWPSNKVYYTISTSLPNQTRVTQAINAIKEVTHLEFIQRTTEPNYIEFIYDADGCSSYLGMSGGKQEIRLANWGTMGNVIHEICHALGMLHEHSKKGRDNFITIVNANIIERYIHNFAEYTKSVNTPTGTEDMDFQSIMLYSPYSFSKNNGATITKKNGTTFTVQRLYLSQNDIDIINFMYPPVVVTLRDADNNEYPTVRIGNQLWMAENLKVTKYNDRTSLTINSNNTAWSTSTTGSFCWYNNDDSNKNSYGALYNWIAVNSGKLCPDGWRVPTESDWSTLIDYLGGATGNSGKLKTTTQWASPNAGATNSSGFSAKPGGYRYYTGTFGGMTYGADWWTSTSFSDDKAWVVGVNYNNTNISKYNDNKRNGFAVRCVKE